MKTQITVLLLEDDLLLAKPRAKQLESSGFKVHHVQTAENALALCAGSKTIDVLLIDIKLGNGLQGTTAAEAILGKYQLPLVFLSDESNQNLDQTTSHLPCLGYVGHNASSNVLEATIKLAMRLFAAQQKLPAIIEHQPGMVWLKDTEGRFVTVNQAFLHSCGLKELNQIIGKTDADIWPKVLAEKYMMDDQMIMETGKSITLEEPISDKGVLTWFETFKTPVYDAKKQVIGTTGYSRDVTARITTATMRLEIESRYRALVDLAFDGIILCSHEGKIIEANDFISELTGLEKSQILGKPISDFPFHGDKRDKYQPQFSLLRQGKVVRTEKMLTRPDGSNEYLEIRSKMMPDGNFHFLFHSVSDRHQAESALRLKTTFLEAVANSSADGIMVVDLQGKKILQNQRTIDLWKIPPEVVNDPDGTRQAQHVMRVTKNPEQFMAEIIHQKQFPLEINQDELELIDGTVLDRYSAPVIGPDGLNYGRVYTFHDVTSFRQAEASIQRLLAEKEVLLKEVHHRIKNNMGTLIGLLMLQADTLTDSAAIQALEDAQRRIQSMMVLYEKLYTSAIFDSVSVANYLPALVDEIIANFPNYSIVTVEKQIQDFMLDAKSVQVLGILANELLTNIMKYAFVGRKSGKISIIATKTDQRVTLSIADDGNGMPEAVDLGVSTGFGLMLVDLLIKQLSGTITVDRSRGTRFVLEFSA